jgi:hypothetical protein
MLTWRRMIVAHIPRISSQYCSHVRGMRTGLPSPRPPSMMVLGGSASHNVVPFLLQDSHKTRSKLVQNSCRPWSIHTLRATAASSSHSQKAHLPKTTVSQPQTNSASSKPILGLSLDCTHFEKCSGCTLNTALESPPVLEDARNFFKGYEVEDFELHTGGKHIT